MKPPLGSPCRECPFRRKSLPGYLGSDTPEHFLVVSMAAAVPMPCHLQVDYDKPGWEAEASRVNQCSGHAIFLSNICKEPRTRAVQTLPPDRELVLATPQEFIGHHRGDMVRYMQLAYPGVPVEQIKEMLGIKPCPKVARRSKRTAS